MALPLRLAARFDTPARSALAALLLALALCAALLAAFPASWRAAEAFSGDWIWRATAADSRERRIILVDIDEPSLRQLGNWPWPRARLAQLSDRLASEGAALQIFDLILPSPAAGDAQLLASLRKNNALLAQVFALEDNTQAASGVASGALDWAACPPNLPVARGHIANAPAFADLPVGHITPLIENDGVVRRQPALICSDGKAYPALFIAALTRGLNLPDIRLEAGQGLLAPALAADRINARRGRPAARRARQRTHSLGRPTAGADQRLCRRHPGRPRAAGPARQRLGADRQHRARPQRPCRHAIRRQRFRPRRARPSCCAARSTRGCR